MNRITEQQYKLALNRIEELIPIVTDDMPKDDPKAVELALMSDIVIDYEKEHFPIEKPTVAELIDSSLKENKMTQRQLASIIGVSPSRVNDYISGRSLPTLHVAGTICKVLGISPSMMLGLF